MSKKMRKRIISCLYFLFFLIYLLVYSEFVWVLLCFFVCLFFTSTRDIYLSQFQRLVSPRTRCWLIQFLVRVSSWFAGHLLAGSSHWRERWRRSLNNFRFTEKFQKLYRFPLYSSLQIP